MGFDADGRGEDDFVVLPERHVQTALANAHVNKPSFRGFFEVFGRDKSIRFIQVARELMNLQCCPVHLAGNAAVRTSEMSSADFGRND